jgi:outer membrane protein assembly factor BamB
VSMPNATYIERCEMTASLIFTGQMRYRCETRRIGGAFVCALLLIAVAGLAHGADSGESALPDAFASADLLWEVRLGTHQYTIPRIDRGRVLIGINDLALEHPSAKQTGGGILMALDAGSGEMIWQMPIPRNMKGTQAPFHFNHWKCGVCSRPAIDDDRLYIVSPRGEVLCLDRNGQADGNNGPFVSETEYMVLNDPAYKLTAADGDIIWRFDMIEDLNVCPHDVCGSSPIVHGDYVYAGTSNGQDDKHARIVNPKAPTLIALDKRTGRLAGVDGELIGERMFHGNWSSPVATEFGGRTMILFGGGDGVLYAFEPVGASKAGDKPKVLKRIWKHDCNPSDYRERDGTKVPYANWRSKSPIGPSEVISTPVVHKGRIYVAIGQSPIHGPGQGMLSCLDAATGKEIWTGKEVDRSIVDVAIHEGLAYISDFSGRLHCFDAETGRHYWQHELEGGVWCASPVVANGKVYVSTEKSILWVLKADREKEVISRSRLRSMGITPVVQDGVFYLPTQKRLFALKIR